MNAVSKPMPTLNQIRTSIRTLHLSNESDVLEQLAKEHGLEESARKNISARAVQLIKNIRTSNKPGLMEVFLAEYGLSTSEGIALMCLAEALLRVPDAVTIDELIDDKITPSSWGEHLGKSSSSLVNASTWALMFTGKILQDSDTDGLAETLRGAVRRLGEPVIRAAVKIAMKEMGHQFVLGRDIAEAVKRGKPQADHGYLFSYDMLGEAALTEKDADGYYNAYADAIHALSAQAENADIIKNSGISIKLSALHPRYEVSQKQRVMDELVPKVKALAIMAKDARIGLNIDAEEADRLDLSLDVIEAAFRSPKLAGWDGFGVVVQAYGKRASAVIHWLYDLTVELDRKIMVRLVKGAYWDMEIKQAQIEGLVDFTVFTRKEATDVSYICCAKLLLAYSDRIYPQFATHNAHTVSAILEMANDATSFEFQRLHGMGDGLYDLVVSQEDVRCRIYAPVGAHRDLLAYLVRRLLENGANSSFVNQIVDKTISPELIATDPFEILNTDTINWNHLIVQPKALYKPMRPNSIGWDLRSFDHIDSFNIAREAYKKHEWLAKPLIVDMHLDNELIAVYSPNDSTELIGCTMHATLTQAEVAIVRAMHWANTTPKQRCTTLNIAADLYESNAGEIFAALCREAGKTAPDAVAEIREAVDFLRFYAAEATRLGDASHRGIITCISPWNFPLAIFTGQIAAALAAGNGVLAKPADPTPIIASIGARLMHEAGVPKSVLQLILGRGSVIGGKLTADSRINGICFTGSTGVAQMINRAAASTLLPDATFIAETGGLNAMIVDSTALPEQAIQDIVDSAFRSCGQRCSALRMLYLQEDVADEFIDMLYGAMDELEISHPWELSSDVGPLISASSHREIKSYIETARSNGTLLKYLEPPAQGYFLGPAVIRVDGINALDREVFGPVLHIATFNANEIDQIIDDVNNTGYGLTFGLHTRIDDRVEKITQRLNVGNMYVNRNQIGAVVGTQPFGGEGLSGTGPKAGGPLYVSRFTQRTLANHDLVDGKLADELTVQTILDSVKANTHHALQTVNLPGPTGESNRWSTYARGTVLCLGPTLGDALQQIKLASNMGCATVAVVPNIDSPNSLAGFLERDALSTLKGIDAVVLWSSTGDLLQAREALAKRDGPFVPLIATMDMEEFCVIERHLCIDTTAAGGNATLLAAQ